MHFIVLNTPFLHFHTLHTFTSLLYIYTYAKIFTSTFKLSNDWSSVETSRSFTHGFYFKLFLKTFTYTRKYFSHQI